jgi:hypothetical protein
MSPRTLAVAVAATILLACSDASGPNDALTLKQLAGTWDMSRAELLLAADTTIRFDLKAAVGLAATLSITSAGNATLVATVSGEAADTIHAYFTLRGDTLTYAAMGSEAEFKLRLAGNGMTWVALYTDDFFDITGDGVGDESRERYAWVRR